MNSSQIRERGSWRLLVALAAIAFALVAVVAAPRPAVATEYQAGQPAEVSNNDDLNEAINAKATPIKLSESFQGDALTANTLITYEATIDLNGKTLNQGTGMLVVYDNGALIVEDTSGSQNGALTGSNSNALVLVGNKSAGTFTLTQGKLTNGSGPCIRTNYAGSSITVNGGSVTGGVTGGSDVYSAIYLYSDTNLTMTAGTVTANSNASALTARNACEVTIEGGTITSNSNAIPTVQAGVAPNGPAELTVSGSSTKIENTGGYVALYIPCGTAHLNGGTISNSSQTNQSNPSAALTIGGTNAASVTVDLAGANVNATATFNDATMGAVAIFSGDVTMTAGKIVGGGSEGSTAIAAVQVGSSNTNPGASFTVNGANAVITGNGSVSDNKYTGNGGGIFVNGYGVLDVKAGQISGTRAIDLNGTEGNESYDGAATVTISGGTLIGSATSSCLYLPSTSKYTDAVTISGGNLYGGAGIVNLGANVTITGNPGPTITPTAEGDVQAGSNKFDYPPAGVVNFDAEGNNYNSTSSTTVEGGVINGGIVNGVAESEGTDPDGTPKLDVSGGVINGGIQTATMGATTIGDSTGAGPTITGEITNAESSETTVYGGSFDQAATNSLNSAGSNSGLNVAPPANAYFGSNPEKGTVVDVNGGYDETTGNGNTYTGTTMPNLTNQSDVDNVTVESVAPGDKSTLEVPNGTTVKNDTNQSIEVQSPSSSPITVPAGSQATPDAPTQEPSGDASAIQSQVLGVKAPIINDMKPYADVTVSADLYTWTIEANEDAGDTPATTISQNLVVPILGAIQRGGCTLATSAQVSTITLEVPGSTSAQQLTFANQVLANAVPIANSPAKAQETTLTLADLEGKTCGVIATTTSGTITYTFNFVGEATPEPPAATSEPVYRLYNDNDHLHLYTSDQNEIEVLKTQGWVVDFEGEPCWYAPLEGTEDAAYEIIRLYNPHNGDHYFVKATDTYQINILLEAGMTRDSESSSIWSAADDDANIEVSTLFNPFAEVDTHLYTPSQTEVDFLLANDWELNTPIIWGVPAPEES